MNSFPRCPLIGNIALAAYLAVHVFAGVLHHHDGECCPGRLPSASETEMQIQTSNQVENHADE
jgi:hypothetical protein